MDQHYRVHLPDGTEYGPVDRATLAAWNAEGRLPEETLVWPEGAPEWLSVPAALAWSPAAPLPATGAAAVPSPQPRPAAHAGGSGSLRTRPSSSAPPERSGGLVHPVLPSAPPFPVQRVLLVAGGLLVLLALAIGSWSLLHPWVARRLEMAAIQRQATPDRRLEDREAGLVLELPSGWVALRPGNRYVTAADARMRLAQPGVPAFAALTVAARPRLMDTLDAYLDELLQERLPRQPSIKEAGRADVQLGRGRGRLVRTRWDDGLSPMQGALVAWADGYDLFALEAWAPAGAGSFAAELESLCRGLTPTGVVGKRVDDAVERLSLEVPELPRDALRLLVAERMSRGRPLDDVPQAALFTVSRGLDALAPAEASEMRAIYQQVWAPVAEADRVRIAALLNAVKAGRELPAAEVAQVREALKSGVLALPPAERERLQQLSGRALRKSLLAP
ncbi:MAG: GYF domain-containing protein [Betaproteobacteria bacterium]